MGENADKKTFRYYSTERPLMPGCCPRAGVYEVKNFETKMFCDEVGCEAWGYVDYMRELSPEEAADYELLSAGLKTFWCVTTAITDDRYRKIVMKSREYKDARIEAAVKRNEAKEEAEVPDENEEDDDVESGSLRDSIDKIWKKKR